MQEQGRPWKILLVEDNPADVRLTQEALKELKVHHHLQVAEDGLAALKYLTVTHSDQPDNLPDLILLDLNLPRMSGLETLAVIKASDALKIIPVIIMSTSGAAEDVSTAYRLDANCYTQKPPEIDQFYSVIDNIRSFWLETALLPGRPAGNLH